MPSDGGVKFDLICPGNSQGLFRELKMGEAKRGESGLFLRLF